MATAARPSTTGGQHQAGANHEPHVRHVEADRRGDVLVMMQMLLMPAPPCPLLRHHQSARALILLPDLSPPSTFTRPHLHLVFFPFSLFSSFLALLGMSLLVNFFSYYLGNPTRWLPSLLYLLYCFNNYSVALPKTIITNVLCFLCNF